jgi:L-talarate/galactarate dehydratase
MDPIQSSEVTLNQVPLKQALSDAKVLTGRQRPLAHVDLLCVMVETRGGARGFGFSYSLRAGGMRSSRTPRIRRRT